jgi:XTP/dITP diphosphohydrolase
MLGVQLVLASRNPHKLRELGALLAPHLLVAIPEHLRMPPETGASFAENALTKARFAARHTDEPSLGEDSGIEVVALGGGPGIRSARYAGEDATDADNLAKLLRETAGATERRAAYRCALAFAEPEGAEQIFEARCEGILVSSPRGEGGFGYDPIFVPVDHHGPERTMAELSPVEKNAISHRGRAALLLFGWLARRT